MTVIAYHFWSPTCGPCKVIKPAMDVLKEDFETITWYSVNTHDDSNNFKDTFGVTMVPTVVVVVLDKDGKQVYSERHSGTTMAHYYRIIRAAIKFDV